MRMVTNGIYISTRTQVQVQPSFFLFVGVQSLPLETSRSDWWKEYFLGEQERNGFKFLLKDPFVAFHSSKDISTIVHKLYEVKQIG